MSRQSHITCILSFVRLRGANQPESEETDEDEFSELSIIHDIFPPKVYKCKYNFFRK